MNMETRILKEKELIKIGTELIRNQQRLNLLNSQLDKKKGDLKALNVKIKRLNR